MKEKKGHFRTSEVFERRMVTKTLLRDFHDVQVTKLLGKLRKSTILKRERPGTDALWRTHTSMSSGSDRRSVKVLKAQMHEAQNIGEIR